MTVKSILKYHRRTKDIFLIYGSGEEELVVKGYRDASFGIRCKGLHGYEFPN